VLTAEMKRLYVRPSARGKGLGLKLAQAAIHEARKRGYERNRARHDQGQDGCCDLALRTLGFCEIAPYYDNPIPGALYWS